MTPDEQRMLSELAEKFAKTPAPPKDAEAEEFIRTRIGNRPDALYLMTQTVLIQNMALEQAQRQLRDLQQQQGGRAAAGSGSFLGGQQQPNYSAPPPQYAQQQYAQAPQYAAPGGGGPSFLRGAAQTAAGVAAGALAFEGIRSLFSHPGYGGGGYGFGDAGGLGGYPGGGGETIVNNYYDGDQGRDDYSGGGNDDLQMRDDRDSLTGDSGDYSNVSDSSDFGSGDDGGFDDGGGFDDNFA